MHYQIKQQPLINLHLQWPKPGKMSRKVVKRSQMRSTYKYASITTGKTIQCESRIELKFVMRADIDPLVQNIQAQPVLINYSINGVTRKHYPDYLITSTNRLPTFTEIKDESDPDLPQYIELANQLQSPLFNLGFGYQLLTSKEILVEPYLSNTETLLRYARTRLSELSKMRALQILSLYESITWGEVAQDQIEGITLPILSYLFIEGLVHFDQSQRINTSTQFHLSR